MTYPTTKDNWDGTKTKKSFLTDDLVSLFSHDVSRQLVCPFLKHVKWTIKEEKKLTKSDNEKQTMAIDDLHKPG